jgi:ATP-dependent exoDNAse (exonuclease V) alpha subunit
VAKIHTEHPKCANIKISHLDDGVAGPLLCICIGCRVELKGKNLQPKWALFNGTIGIVVDIVFAKGTSPNLLDQPDYILADFPLFNGPAILEDHPTIVALAPTNYGCQYRCCKQRQILLELAFGKTIHKVQGSSVGTSKPGQPVNQIKYIIADIGNKGV